MVNRVVLVGRLTRDPEQKTTPSGTSVCDFSIAVDRRVKQEGGQEADFFRVTAWGKTAEFVGRYLAKGRLVAVDGRLQQRKYTAQDGTTREVVEVIAENVQGLDRPSDRPADRPQPDGDDPFAQHERPARRQPSGAVPPAPVEAQADDSYDPFADGD
ncbi:MAG: single-stranded DNA-binding protein [Fimbriimonadaceae bacterium]